MASIYHESLSFVIVSKETADQVLGISNVDSSILYISDVDRIAFPPPFTFENLKEWVVEHRYSFFTLLESDNFNDWTKSGKTVIGVVNPATPESKPYDTLFFFECEKESLMDLHIFLLDF